MMMRLMVAICMVSFSLAYSQIPARHPRELIDFLNHKEYARPDSVARIGLFTCGQLNADHKAAEELVAHGEKAIPEIEREFRENSFRTPGSFWLQTVYARLRGRAAYPDLFQIALDSRRDRDSRSNDTAIAMTLGITPFVSSRHATGRVFRCAGSEEPHYALDRLIAGWLQMDRDAVLSALAPETKAEFERRVPAGTWLGWAHNIWQVNPPEWTAVAYQVGSVVQLKSYDGQPCDGVRARFVPRTPDEGGRYLAYAIETEDLSALLKSVSACAHRFR
jgi:hypothetical protein